MRSGQNKVQGWRKGADSKIAVGPPIPIYIYIYIYIYINTKNYWK